MIRITCQVPAPRSLASLPGPQPCFFSSFVLSFASAHTSNAPEFRGSFTQPKGLFQNCTKLHSAPLRHSLTCAAGRRERAMLAKRLGGPDGRYQLSRRFSHLDPINGLLCPSSMPNAIPASWLLGQFGVRRLAAAFTVYPPLRLHPISLPLLRITRHPDHAEQKRDLLLSCHAINTRPRGCPTLGL